MSWNVRPNVETQNYLERIIKVLLDIRHQTSQPGCVSIIPFDQEIGEFMNYIIYDVVMPAFSRPTDVVQRELTVIVDGVKEKVVIIPKGQMMIKDVRIPQDSHVTLSLVDIDDSNNRSRPTTLQFVAIDVVPPPPPGDMGVIVVDEEIGPSPGP